VEIKVEGIENQFNEIIVENFPNLGKHMSIHGQEVYKIPNTHDQKRYSVQHVVVKLP
jgi:hypothetical protein